VAASGTIFDLVLMDVQMPEGDGSEATPAIRRKEKTNCNHEVVVTAHAMKGDQERCLAVGTDDYLSKPTGTQELDAALHTRVAGSPGALDSFAQKHCPKLSFFLLLRHD
jgi:CheY-like chemotaxis protein